MTTYSRYLLNKMRLPCLGWVDICIILDICQQLHFRRNNGQRCLSSFAGSPGCTSDGKPNVSGSLMLCYGLRGLGHNGGCCRQSTVNGTASTSDSPAGVTTEYGSVSISISSMTPTWNTSSSTVRSSGHILRRLGHPKKRGQASQALGRSRGGFSTKIHVSVDGLGNPLRFTLTGGQEHDVTQANELIAGMESEYVIADPSIRLQPVPRVRDRGRRGSGNTSSLESYGTAFIRYVPLPRASPR